MRAWLLLGLLTSSEDDPKLARGGRVEEDDPKLARAAAVERPAPPRPRRPVPRFELAYRWLRAAGLEGPPTDFNVVELKYFPSSGYFRFGMSAEAGIGADLFSSWFLTAGASVGVQVPWRVTPFLDGRFSAGLLGGSYLGHTAVSWVYMGGIEGGASVFLVGRFHLTAAVGWTRPVFSGIDVDALRENPLLAPKRKEFANDTVTVKVGLGF